MQRKICIPLTTRGNYGKLRSTLEALGDASNVDVQVVVGGRLLVASHAEIVEQLHKAGVDTVEELPYQKAGSSPEAIARSASRCATLATELFARLKPDIVVLTADRYEVLALALAAVCLNIRIAHLEGGEQSGSIDERIRHAVSKLAHIHFPANEDAAARLIRLGEPKDAVHVVGSPSIDLLANPPDDTAARLREIIVAAQPEAAQWLDGHYIVVSQHPVATEHDAASDQYRATGEAVQRLGLPTFWLRPNIDAGADAHALAIRSLKEAGANVCVLGALELPLYGTLLKNAQCLVGNSSSALREGAFLGVPAVNVGNRQTDRGRTGNVVDCASDPDAIFAAARERIAHGPFPSDTLYGDGHSGARIAAALTGALPPLEKPMSY